MEGPAIQNRRIFSFAWLSKATIVEITSVLFIILFLYTGISKLMEYSVFKEQIADSPILKPMAPFIAWALPLTEFLVSLLLIIPRWRLKGLYASLSLMIAFTIYIIAIMTFNKELPCSCGGIISLLSWEGHLVFNSAFILLAFIGVRLERQNRRAIKADMNILNA
ncbi:MauE/DoxX family redox-associated membrane protein [Longitalea luteola]|uniref:MauE/DoxX family redox-associated membrane protein n=1 Tax=Longitalea luteola TaxID=2812563 RepID=UPI001A9656C7|nr:MauE/DoxX family redox-associated membrane protein [Longitalea luteola]